jgi:2-iminobutanoate/2-iminopropanoate deaminase
MREIIAAPRSGLDLRRHYGYHQSPAIRTGGLIFCSGMLPVDPETGERRHGTLISETHVIFGNLKLLLESAGSSLDRLVQVHALIYDSIEYDVLNCAYRQYVASGPPAPAPGTLRPRMRGGTVHDKHIELRRNHVQPLDTSSPIRCLRPTQQRSPTVQAPCYDHRWGAAKEGLVLLPR